MEKGDESESLRNLWDTVNTPVMHYVNLNEKTERKGQRPYLKK